MNYILYDKIKRMDFYKFSIINNLTSRIKINSWKPIENYMLLEGTGQKFIMCKNKNENKKAKVIKNHLKAEASNNLNYLCK